MGVLSSYLEKHEIDLRKEQEEDLKVVTDWLSALNRLSEQLAEWIRTVDADRNLLTYHRVSRRCWEPSLPPYEVDCLEIQLGRRWTIVRPKTRRVGPLQVRVAGAAEDDSLFRPDGIVQLGDDSHADWYLYRRSGASEQWFIGGRPGLLASRDEGLVVRPLTKESFESALFEHFA